MFKLIRWFLGLCQHDDAIVKKEDVNWHSKTDSSFVAIDMGKRNIVHHTNYLMQCKHCGRLKQKRIKRG